MTSECRLLYPLWLLLLYTKWLRFKSNRLVARYRTTYFQFKANISSNLAFLRKGVQKLLVSSIRSLGLLNRQRTLWLNYFGREFEGCVCYFGMGGVCWWWRVWVVGRVDWSHFLLVLSIITEVTALWLSLEVLEFHEFFGVLSSVPELSFLWVFHLFLIAVFNAFIKPIASTAKR